MINQCPCPILAFPNSVQSDLDRAMLAYDGSAEADEALFLATYSTVRWQRALTVLTVETSRTGKATLDYARDYLEQNGVTWAKYILADGPVNDAILRTAESQEINLLIMGGIGRRSVLRRVSGSTVEQILRDFEQPIWICR
jgi:nucleotide-binding universal stress UspA family protein